MKGRHLEKVINYRNDTKGTLFDILTQLFYQNKYTTLFYVCAYFDTITFSDTLYLPSKPLTASLNLKLLSSDS